jgi:hypothetical protein
MDFLSRNALDYDAQLAVAFRKGIFPAAGWCVVARYPSMGGGALVA